METVQDMDASGLLCPLPVLKARKRLQGMAPGEVLRLITTDPAAVIDVPHFCNESGHVLISCSDQTGADQTGADLGGGHIFMIRRS